MLVSIIVTSIQLTYEAREERENMRIDINYTINNMRELVIQKIWNLDEAGLQDTLTAIVSNKYIFGIRLVDENGLLLNSLGETPFEIDPRFQVEFVDGGDSYTNYANQSYFLFKYPLTHNFENDVIPVGSLFVYSNNSIINDYMKAHIVRSFFITLGQLLILSFLFYVIVIRLVGHPVWLLSNLLSQQHQNVPVQEDLMSRTEHMSERHDEIGDLFANYLRMVQLLDSKNRQVLRHQKDLESMVAERTKELQKALSDLKQTSEFKSQFLANMSHEIRTPMNGIIGMTELLKESPLSDEQSHFVATIQNSGKTLTNIINDILDISKIEAGKLTLERIQFDMEELLDLCATLFSPQAHQKRIQFNLDFDPDAPRLYFGDPTRINQVVLNLLNNAFKFTESGQITLSLRLKSIIHDMALLEICVKDSGVGISENDRDRLFEAFTQADASTTRTYGGTGLGLAICQRLVRIMNGRIHLESELAKGASFFVEIPLDVAPHPKDLLPDTQFLKDKKVTIIRHLDETQKILKQSCEALGLEVSCSTSSSHFNSRLDTKKSDVLLIGNNVSGIRSSEILQSLNEQMIPETIGVISGRDVVKELGAWAFKDRLNCISSPVSKNNLLRFLKSEFLLNNENSANNTVQPDSTFSVMVAEDNMVNTLVIKGLLNSLNINPVICSNGRELLNELDTTLPDLILMDCEMPVLDGYETTKIIRSHKSDRIRNIKIIGLSAHALQEQIDYALEIGMDHYLKKPIQKDRLASLLNKYR